MPENQSLLHQLEQMLHWKKSKKFYAEKLNITEAEVDELMKELKSSEDAQNEAEVGNYIGDLENQVVRFFEDIQKGTGEVVFNSKEEIKSLDELIEKCNIDTDKWEITKYVQNYWGNAEQPHYQVKAWLGKKKDEQIFQDSFVSFLETGLMSAFGDISHFLFPLVLLILLLTLREGLYGLYSKHKYRDYYPTVRVRKR